MDKLSPWSIDTEERKEENGEVILKIIYGTVCQEGMEESPEMVMRMLFKEQQGGCSGQEE